MDELPDFPAVTQQEPLRRVVDDLAFDSRTRQVWHGERLLGLTRIEYDLLLALAESCGSICTPQDLMSRVWGLAWMGDSHVVETHIGRLRAKLGESGRHPGHIHTVRGIGYRFQAHPQEHVEPVEPLTSGRERVLSVLLQVTVSAAGDVISVAADIVDGETESRELPEFA